MKRVAVLATSSTMADLPHPLRTVGKRNLKKRGWAVVFGKHVDHIDNRNSASVSKRLDDLYWAADSPDIDVIMPVYGGYGANELLDHIDFERLQSCRKRMVGFSDTTSLLIALHERSGWFCSHGPSFSVFCDPNLMEYTFDAFEAVVSGAANTFYQPAVTADDDWFLKEGFGPREEYASQPWLVFRPGAASAPVIGGNLELLCSLAGTDFFPNLDGRILVIEDTGKHSSAVVFRYLLQLRQLGAFERLSALLIGAFPRKSELHRPQVLKEMLAEIIPNTSSFPVIANIHCSHCDPKLSIPFSGTCSVSAKDVPSLGIDGSNC